MKLTSINLNDEKFINMLIDHFNYSINDIQSYDELTETEKSICPKDVFNNYAE